MSETPENSEATDQPENEPAEQPQNEAAEQPQDDAPEQPAQMEQAEADEATREQPADSAEEAPAPEAPSPVAAAGTANTHRSLPGTVGQRVAVGAAIVVAFFSGILVYRAANDDSGETDLASFGRTEGGPPPSGGPAWAPEGHEGQPPIVDEHSWESDDDDPGDDDHDEPQYEDDSYGQAQPGPQESENPHPENPAPPLRSGQS